MPTDQELQGGIVGYGISNILFSLLGGLPTATYSQNVGIVATTKVINRCVLGGAALILLIAGVIPKFSSLLTTIPYCVLGGATVSVFASIAMTGDLPKIITNQSGKLARESLACEIPIPSAAASPTMEVLRNVIFCDDLRQITGCSGYIACSTPQHCTAQRQRRCKLICTFDSLSYITKMFPSENPDGNIFAFTAPRMQSWHPKLLFLFHNPADNTL